MLGTADTWAIMPRGTNGKWYVPQKYSELRLKLEYNYCHLSGDINAPMLIQYWSLR